MMKLRSDNLIVLGLSEENVSRLKLGQPIFFDGRSEEHTSELQSQ